MRPVGVLVEWAWKKKGRGEKAVVEIVGYW